MSSLSTRDDSTPGRPLASGLLPGLAVAVLAGLAVLATTACDPRDVKDALAGHGDPTGSTDAAVNPGSDGGVPSNLCAATLCPTGTRCEVQVSACVTKPCPADTAVCVKDVPPPPVCPPVCKIACENGNVLDSNGCPTCACNPPPADPCITVKCSAGTHCEATTVMCIKAPCPPVAGCVANPPSVPCGGFVGLACPGAGKCVDDPSDSCDPTKGGGDCGGICSCLPIPCPGAAMFDGSPKVCACGPASNGGTGGAGGSGGSGGGSGGAGGGGAPATLKEGESCGGFRPANSPTCADGLLCQEQAGSLCGAADAPGICVKIPATCPKQAPQPVCGCDGKTYASPCLATKALVGILDLGACK
jgi:uncharacterized membrane protein YgcG